MIAQKETAPGQQPESGEINQISADILKVVTTKVLRASFRKKASLVMSDGLLKIKPEWVAGAGFASGPVERLAGKISDCSTWLMIRGNASGARIAGANYCRQSHLCGSCAAARSRRLVASYLGKVRAVAGECDGYMLTLTLPSLKGSTAIFDDMGSADVRAEGQALRVGIDILLSAWRKLWNRRKAKGTGPLWQVAGAVVGLEVTRGDAGWHPHLHVLLMMPRGQIVDVVYLRQEWERLTGGRQIRIDRVNGGLFGLVEVLKYSSKPVELKDGQAGEDGLFWRFLTYSVLKGRQCVFGFGNLRGVVEPDDLNEPENLNETEEQEFWYRWKSSLSAYESWVPDMRPLSEVLATS